MVVGLAMETVLVKHGIDIGRINYQDNGNWGVFKPEGPYQHFHLYGRAKSAKKQTYGQACHFPHKNEHPEFYNNLEPLSAVDVQKIREEIIKILSLEKYSDKAWKIESQNENQSDTI